MGRICLQKGVGNPFIPVIYFCGATKEKQILPPLIMFLLGLVIFVISVHFSVKYHKEKTKYTKYKIDKSLTYTFT